MNYNIKKIKLDFPIFKKKINKKKFVYLDNASTSQKPKIVIKKQSEFYKKQYSSINRGIYKLSNINSNYLEEIRIKIAKFINAKSPEEIIFTNNTTESINFISNSLTEKNINKNNNIIISIMEHHSNIIPWYILSNKIGFNIKIWNINNKGELNLNNLIELIDKNTKIISITHLSNVLGTLNPIEKIISIVKKYNIISIIDGAQAISHKIIDVQKIKCDFYLFSGHKLYAPTGTGIIYAKKKIINKLNNWKTGGGIISNIDIKNNNIKKIEFINPPWKFEPGTQNIESIIGLGTAIDYINKININNIINHEKKIINYTLKKLKLIKNIEIYGSKKKTAIISFNIKNIHCYDIGVLLDQNGISIRTGNQCAIPLIKHYNTTGVCRLSIGMYTSKNDINKFIYTIKKIIKRLK